MRSSPNRLPCNWLVPPLVTMLMAPPGAPPSSAENVFRFTWNSCTAACVTVDRTVPVSKTLFKPSSMNVLFRPLPPPIPSPEWGVTTMRPSRSSTMSLVLTTPGVSSAKSR